MEFWMFIHRETYEVLYVTTDDMEAYSLEDKFPQAVLTSVYIDDIKRSD